MKPVCTLLVLVAFCMWCHQGSAQCNAGQVEVTVHILSDNYPTETHWDLKDGSGNIVFAGEFGNLPTNTIVTFDTTLCLPAGSCYTFHVEDDANDGICCGYGIGGYQITVDGVQVINGGQFGGDVYESFNCPPGLSCAGALPAFPGNTYAAVNETWYSFTPDSNGVYNFSTCSLSACNTVIWLYDHCTGLVYDASNAGTIGYSNDACGLQSDLNISLEEGQTCFIRVGSVDTACADSINWSIAGPFPIYGCTDPNSCNYNPLATVDTGGCLLAGSPGCTSDLVVLEDVLINSMNIDDEMATNCNVVEQCMAGYGNRRIIRFTTHIQNIGQLDYYIGDPTANPDQFTFNNCHNHAHYEGYAEYVLYKADGSVYPIGFKNGFCVIDLECWNGGSGQYGCNNMGISAGCGDYYSSGLSCQWIDITDVDTGDYVLVVRVNWDQSPDANGNYESNYDNNWAQVCLNIYYDANNLKQFTVDTLCDPYVDCTGQIYGAAQPDCEGTCNGTKMRGDLDNNHLLNLFDINGYMDGTLNETMTANACNDLHADGEISIYDAALLNDCTLYGSNYPLPGGGYKNFCSFPTGVFNFNDTAVFSLGDVNYDDQYVDILVKNPAFDLNAYAFEMNGLTIAQVVNLADPSDYAATPQKSSNNARIACYSAVDSSLTKSSSFQPLCRVYYSAIDDTVCIAQVTGVVNANNEKIVGVPENACKVFTGFVSGIEASQSIDVVPNPTTGNLRVRFTLPTSEAFSLYVMNALGQVVYSESHQDGNLQFNGELNLTFLPVGSYTLRVAGTSVNASRKIAVVR